MHNNKKEDSSQRQSSFDFVVLLILTYLRSGTSTKSGVSVAACSSIRGLSRCG